MMQNSQWRCLRGIGAAIVVHATVMSTVPTSASAQRATPESARAASVRPSPSSTALDRVIHIDLDGVSVVTAVNALAERADVRIVYQAEQLDAITTRVTLHARQIPLRIAFANVLRGTGLQAEPIASEAIHIRAVATPSAPAVQGSISGTVLDVKTALPVSGATVTLDRSTTTVMTGDNGSFRLTNVAPGPHTVSVRRLGYMKATRSVTVVADQVASLQIGIEPSVNALDQVVVTGTVVATAQREVPSAMTVITAKDLEQRGITKIDQLFRGDVPGLFALNRGSGNLLDAVAMFSRGATSLAAGIASVPIKTYVDGVELADAQYLNTIDPRSIERIEIITGPQASTIYGSAALNGVMQIFTKRGTTSRPAFSATLLSGGIQNNFSAGLAPQHDLSSQVSGTDGRWSYQAGAAYTYVGPWSPAKTTSTMAGNGGMRADYGVITADASLRLSMTQNLQQGTITQGTYESATTGKYVQQICMFCTGRSHEDRRQTLSGQTLSGKLTYAPTSWWSHEVIVGQDVSEMQDMNRAPLWQSPADTMESWQQTRSGRTSIRYATTLRLTMSSVAQGVFSAGADGWQSSYLSQSASSLVLTGTLATPGSPTRRVGRNRGAFVQGQVGLYDALFLTYGVRAEWNPSYGDSYGANIAPRYGLTYARDVGPVTAKLRASYGRATRPPADDKKVDKMQTSATVINAYGTYLAQAAAPELGPEFQQGGEGGLELYLGRRLSVIATRYNQTVDGIIVAAKIDSVRSLTNPSTVFVSGGSTSLDGWSYAPIVRNLNIGSIRNQGWELQGTVTTGPFITKGTYSWTKSRVIGITPKYRALLTGTSYQPGTMFQFFPEHTWAIGMTYATGATNLTLNVNGTGMSWINVNDLAQGVLLGYNRLTIYAPRVAMPSGYRSISPSYATGDLNATHQFSRWLQGVVQVQNVTNLYRNDWTASWASMGRQTKVGGRVRW